MAAHQDEHAGSPLAPKGSGVAKRRKPSVTVLPPSVLHAHLQSRQLINSMKLRVADGSTSGSHSARVGHTAAAAAAAAGGRPREAARSAPACLKGMPQAYVPVRTLPLIFAQRKRHLQQRKALAQHRGPYERRDGEGLLSLPEDVLLKVVCFLTHDELKPLLQVCKALRTTLHSAIAFHFNYNTPSRSTEEAVPPMLGERQRRPARTNVQQVMSRLARGGRGAAGRCAAASGSLRATAPRALDFADLCNSGRAATAPLAASSSA